MSVLSLNEGLFVLDEPTIGDAGRSMRVFTV
jgi:hypothetical protein